MFDAYSKINIIVTVPKKLVNIFRDTRDPNVRFGGNTDASNTRNPAITTNALKIIALPEWCIVPRIVLFLSPVSSA